MQMKSIEDTVIKTFQKAADTSPQEKNNDDGDNVKGTEPVEEPDKKTAQRIIHNSIADN